MKLTLTRLLLVVVAITCASTVVAQKRPRFEAYPVRGKFHGTPAKVNLRSHPQARMFRTMLREGAKDGPNFAGYYTVVTWGCGAGCLTIAIVDCRNGRVYFAPFTASPSFRADFRLNSRLLVVNPPERSGFKDDEPPPVDEDLPSWHVWRDGHFVQLWPKHGRCGTCF